MIDHTLFEDGSERAASETTVTDPVALADRHDVPTETRTYEHDDGNHCEANTAGRAVAGVTDEEGRLLCVVQPDEPHAVLPNGTVESGRDWAAVARGTVAGMTGVEAALDDVLLVREVAHTVDGTVRSRTRHVLFAATLAGPNATLGGLCDDNPWELRWLDAIPDWLEERGDGARADIARALEAGR